MEVMNLVLFGCVFYLALIVIPTLCERGKCNSRHLNNPAH